MGLPRRSIVALLASLVFLAGCGKGDVPAETARGKPGTKAVASAPDELARLVPADAVGLVYAPSLEGLQNRLNVFVREFGPPGVSVDLADALKGMVGPDLAARIDRTRPIAIAVTLVARPSPEGEPARAPEPTPTFIVPVTSGAPIKADDGMGGPPMVTLGSYVGVSPVPGYAAQTTASPLLAGMPGGDVALRLDLAKVVERMRPQLDSLLDIPAGEGKAAGAAAKTLAQVGGALRDFLESAERLDLGLWVDGGKVDLEATFTAKDGSKIAKTLASGEDATPLAAAIPRDFPLEAVMAVRFDEIMKLLLPLMKQAMEQLGPEAQEAFEKQQALMLDVYAQLGGATAMGMGFGKDGIEGVMVARVKDAAAYREKSEALFATVASGPDVGTRIRPLPATKVGGVDVRSWRLEIDFEKMMSLQGSARAMPAGLDMDSIGRAAFGSEGLLMREAIVGDRLVFVYGKDDALLEKSIAAAKGGGKAPPGLAAALAKGGKPTFVLRFELREFITQMMDVMRTVSPSMTKDMPAVPAGPPLPLLLHATSEGRTFRGGVSVDVLGIAQMVKAMMPPKKPR
jgi:hypothetical protein